MKREDIKNIQKDILKQIYNIFKEIDEYEHVQYVPTDEKVTFDYVEVLHEDMGAGNDAALGQYFFAPIPFEETEIAKFWMYVVISDGIDDARREDMIKAITYVNNKLPLGAFVMDLNKETNREFIAFKRVLSYDVEDSNEKVINMIGYEIFESLSVVEALVQKLLDYQFEGGTWDAFVKSCADVFDPSKNKKANMA